MDALINTFVDELKQRVAMYNEDHEFGDSSLPDADGEYLILLSRYILII